MPDSTHPDQPAVDPSASPSNPRVLALEEKIMFIEHEMATVQTLVKEIFSRIETIEKVVRRQKSEFEDRIAGLETLPAEEPPPPHWGRARPE